MDRLRLLSYLSPSIPEDLFALVAETLQDRIGLPVALDFETRVSGPSPESDPFASGRADLAFACGPSYALLKAAGSAIALLPVAPVFEDARAEGRPVYFADVVVGIANSARTFPDLAGSVWCYNDRYSRSGWQRMLERLGEIGHAAGPEEYFRRLIQSGSHLRSIELVADGTADAAAVDSNTLWLRRRADPGLAGGLRVIESWGPMPIQPLLARAGLARDLREGICAALLGLHENEAARRRLEEFGVRRFAPVEERDYAGIRPVGVAAAGNS